MAHLASAGARGARLADAYAYGPHGAKAQREAGGPGLPADRSIERKKPPQEPNFTSFARDLFSAEAQGMMPELVADHPSVDLTALNRFG